MRLRAILETKDLRVLESSEEKTAVEHCERLPGGIDVLIADLAYSSIRGLSVIPTDARAYWRGGSQLLARHYWLAVQLESR